MNNKILILMFCMILLIGNATAFTIDNVKSYDVANKEVTVKNSFGFGDDVAKIQLKSDLNVIVPRGYQKVAEFDVEYFLDDNGGLDKVAFHDLKKQFKEIDRNFDLKVKEITQVEYDDYSCSDVWNETNQTFSKVCEISGSHFEDKVTWRDFSVKDLVKNQKLTIGIFTNVEKGDKVEWIPTFFGVEIDEWASWEEDLLAGVVAAWDFENTTFTDVSGNGWTGINHGVAITTGYIGNGADFENGDNDYIELGDLDLDGNVTYSLWINMESPWIYEVVTDKDCRQAPTSCGAGSTCASNARLAFDKGDVTWVNEQNPTGITWSNLNTGYNLTDLGTWIYVVVSVDVSNDNFTVYKNGEQVYSYAYTGDICSDGNAQDRWIGRNQDGGTSFDGIIDEFTIFNIALTPDEVEYLNYSYSQGCGFGDDSCATPSELPEVDLQAPENYHNSTVSTLDFIAFVSDDVELLNVSFYLNGVVNETNSSGVNATNYTFTKTLPDGEYNWTVGAYDNDSQETIASAWYFEIDTSDPLINITNPTQDEQIIATSNPHNTTINWTVEDSNLESCWINNGTSNISVTCEDNHTYLNLGPGDHTILFYANDSFSHEHFESLDFFINYIQENSSFESPAIEGETYDFYFNLTATSITDFNGSIFWNGTEYSATESHNSTYGLLSSTITLPSVNSTQTIDVYWNYNLNGINYNSSTYQQTITYIDPIVVSTSCDDKAMQFILKDEGNQSVLNVDVDYNIQFGIGNYSQKTIYGSLTGVSTFYICINSSIGNYTIGSGELQYQANPTGYVERRHYLFQDKVLSNETENVTIYDLVNGDATSFLFETSASDLSPYTGKYLGLLRWYPELNSYGRVEMAKTDEDGRTIMRVKVEDVDYRVALYELNGSIIDIQDPTRFACLTSPCTYDFTVQNTETDFTSATGVESSLTFNETTGIFTYIWNDPSGRTKNMTLNVTRETGVNVGVICSESGSGATGVLACDVSGYTGTLRAVAYRTASPATPIASLLHTVGDSISNVASDIGLFISAILAIIGFFIGIFNPILGIVLQIAALIPSLFLGAISIQILIGVAVMGIVVIHFMKRVIGG